MHELCLVTLKPLQGDLPALSSNVITAADGSLKFHLSSDQFQCICLLLAAAFSIR